MNINCALYSIIKDEIYQTRKEKLQCSAKSIKKKMSYIISATAQLETILCQLWMICGTGYALMQLETILCTNKVSSSAFSSLINTEECSKPKHHKSRNRCTWLCRGLFDGGGDWWRSFAPGRSLVPVLAIGGCSLRLTLLPSHRINDGTALVARTSIPTSTAANTAHKRPGGVTKCLILSCSRLLRE